MEHPFFPTTTNRAEALRWLTIAEKLLSSRDLNGSKSFATRARESDPTLTPADQILAVTDTLLAGDRRIGNNQLQDWYSILRLTPQQGRDPELVAAQYRNLALILNPQNNRFAFAEQAFRLVVEAWGTLSNPSRKSMYDKELNFYFNYQQQQQQQPDPFSSNPYPPAMHQNFMFFGGGGTSSGVNVTSPPQTQAPVHFSQVQQVHANATPQVDPVVTGSTREPQNFMSFASGPTPFFGSGSGSKTGHEAFGKPVQESYSTNFGSNVASANRHEQPQQDNYSSFGDKINHNVNVSENVDERIEDEEDVDDMDDVDVDVDVDDDDEEDDENERVDDEPVNDDGSAFWTACPYCYYMYEYPMLYADCTLRCQTCKRAFQAVPIPSPPPFVEGQEFYFCCWGFLPFGFSKTNWNRTYGRPRNSGPRVYIDDDDAFVDLLSDSSESDDDWRTGGAKKKKKTRGVKGKGVSGTQNKVTNMKNVPDGFVKSPQMVETGKKMGPAVISSRKQPVRGAKSFGKLDLNVECINEVDETAHKVNGVGRGVEDNIEGMFFEGLDEFLSSLPILNVVGDDKGVKAA